jgi:hypothetical protein
MTVRERLLLAGWLTTAVLAVVVILLQASGQIEADDRGTGPASTTAEPAIAPVYVYPDGTRAPGPAPRMPGRPGERDQDDADEDDESETTDESDEDDEHDTDGYENDRPGYVH